MTISNNQNIQKNSYQWMLPLGVGLGVQLVRVLPRKVTVAVGALACLAKYFLMFKFPANRTEPKMPIEPVVIPTVKPMEVIEEEAKPVAMNKAIRTWADRRSELLEEPKQIPLTKLYIPKKSL